MCRSCNFNFDLKIFWVSSVLIGCVMEERKVVQGCWVAVEVVEQGGIQGFRKVANLLGGDSRTWELLKWGNCMVIHWQRLGVVYSVLQRVSSSLDNCCLYFRVAGRVARLVGAQNAKSVLKKCQNMSKNAKQAKMSKISILSTRIDEIRLCPLLLSLDQVQIYSFD